jgi:hypothetical protein
MKKVFLVLALALIIAGGAFAQDVKNWIAGDVGFFGGGVQYERVLTPKLSVGAEFYYYTLIFFSNMGVGATVRYYPFSGNLIKGLYADAGLGYGSRWGSADYEYTSQEWVGLDANFNPIYQNVTRTQSNVWSTTRGFLLRPGIGWKFDPGKPGGFFVEPHVQVPLVFGKQKPVSFGWDTESKFGVGVGFSVNVALGFAF